mmetsp:Transcript_4463/g.7918  ORF Transcript_4463/g.7918 Transcript_4463/m.7918 type:complete len:857 (-) Transcript_4463:55-2625(-)
MENHDKLPSEQDRKALMGCLAAVLNIAFAARQRKDSDDTAADNTALGASKIQEDAKGGRQAAADDADTAAINFSIVQNNNDDDGPSSSTRSKSSTTASHALRRTRAFQRELLNVSAELLFLTADHAAVFLPNLDIQCVDDTAMEQELLLRPFLQSLSCEDESFRCIALLMFRFLLLSSEEKSTNNNNPPTNKKELGKRAALAEMTIVGYDARVRFAFKYLAVSVLSFWELKDHESLVMTPERAAAHATRKFEALEDGIASRLSILSQMMQEEIKKNSKGGKVAGAGNKAHLAGQKQQSTFSQSAIRGLKIGAAGVAAGTVFAITGGLAAPAIVGGIAALTGVGSAVSIVATILLLPAATTIFGVGGGTLVASKMSKRTAGLKEFDIVKITPDKKDGDSDADDPKKKGDNGHSNHPDLSRTIFIGGWLRDEHDSERPFGVTPRALADRHELLCRFCSVYAPHVMPDCRRILKEWQGQEDELWDMCKASYGKDPSSLLPFETGPRYDALLTESENAAVDDLIRAIGLPFPTQSIDCSSKKDQEPVTLPPTVNLLSDVLVSSNGEDTAKDQISDAMLRSYHAWDFHAEYGSEQYVVLWEKDLLLELNGSAKKMQTDLAKKAAGEVLKKTVMASLMMACALPAALLSLTNIIDEQWTLVAERSDEAGVLLAQSLLNSNAGHRPVSLIGYSFGARMIVACLKELARNQEIWEQQQDGREQKESKVASLRKSLNMSNKQKEAQVYYTREPASIVEDVILMGCPASITTSKWLPCREIVGGRLINCYSKNDMILALMYRVKNLASSLLTAPVGISHVNVAGIENFDVSELVANHGEYCVAVREILNLVGYNQPATVSHTCSVD